MALTPNALTCRARSNVYAPKASPDRENCTVKVSPEISYQHVVMIFVVDRLLNIF